MNNKPTREGPQMKKNTLVLLLSTFISLSLFVTGCKKGASATSTPEPEDQDPAPHPVDEPIFILSGDEFYFAIQIERVGTYKSGPRQAEIWIMAQVPISKVYMDDHSFEGEAYGQYSAKGVAGELSDSVLREVKYTIAGHFSGPPKCEIQLDVLEEIGEGEECVTLPIIGTSCEEIPESEKETYHFNPIVIPFKSEAEGYDWEYTHTWNLGDMLWTDHFSIVQAGEAFELKLFENLGCVPTELDEAYTFDE